jgi:predicted RNA binding protein YcfA (HicA-like mRNA interferase family)
LKEKKLLKKILAGSKNISFRDFVSLLQAFGFQLSRTHGSHHIFQHTGIRELINIQNVRGQAKPYQIKQFLELIEKNDLQIGEKQ